MRQDSNQGLVSGGASYAAADTITLNDGCATHVVLNVLTVSVGAPTAFSVHTPGSCASIPSDPVVQLSSSGSGTGASFTLKPYWGLIAADVPASTITGAPNGAMFYPPSLSKGSLGTALGPVCVGPPGSCGGGYATNDGQGGGTGMTGAENALFGLAGPQITTGNWISAFGWNAAGHETDGTFSSYFGTDSGKYAQHNTTTNAFGRNAVKQGINLNTVSIFGSDSAPGTLIAATVSGAADNGATLCRLTVNSTTNMATGDYASVTGIVGATACNGQFNNITIVDPTHIDLTGSLFSGTYTSGGAVSDFPFNGASRITVVGATSLNSTALRGALRIALLGDSALQALTTGKDLLVGGSGAMNNCTTCNQTVALGGGSTGSVLTTGAGNFLGGYNSNVTASGTNNAVIIGGNGSGGGAGARGGSQSTILGAQSGNASLTGSNVTTLGFKVANATLTTGTDVILIDSGNQTLDAPAAASSHFLNVAKVIAGDTAGATNPAVCAVGMKCVIGVLRAANFNVTTDQSITIRPLTSSDTGFISAATKYFVTDIYVANCSASLTTAKGALYTAASKGGTIIGATTTPFTNCTGATAAQRLTGLTNQDSTVFSAATLFLSLTTAQGTAATGDVYIIGELVN